MENFMVANTTIMRDCMKPDSAGYLVVAVCSLACLGVDKKPSEAKQEREGRFHGKQSFTVRSQVSG